MGRKVTVTFHLLGRARSLGSSQLSQKCRLSHSVKRSWTGAFFGLRIFSRIATIGFFEEHGWIFILRRSLVTFRPICVLDEYLDWIHSKSLERITLCMQLQTECIRSLYIRILNFSSITYNNASYYIPHRFSCQYFFISLNFKYNLNLHSYHSNKHTKT